MVTIEEHYNQAQSIKATHVLTTLQGWALEVLHKVPKAVTYKETIRVTED
jgi:hypothetical protein